MKEILNCYANWRIDLIIIAGLMAVMLVCDESFITSPIGIVLFLLVSALAKYWRKSGKLPELDEIKE